MKKIRPFILLFLLIALMSLSSLAMVATPVHASSAGLLITPTPTVTVTTTPTPPPDGGGTTTTTILEIFHHLVFPAETISEALAGILGKMTISTTADALGGMIKAAQQIISIGALAASGVGAAGAGAVGAAGASAGATEAAARLCNLKGVGCWTAEYFLLRGLGRTHIFPGDDVGARNHLGRWLGLSEPMTYNDVHKALLRWYGYGGLVYFHLLLKSLAEKGLIVEKE